MAEYVPLTGTNHALKKASGTTTLFSPIVPFTFLPIIGPVTTYTRPYCLAMARVFFSKLCHLPSLNVAS